MRTDLKIGLAAFCAATLLVALYWSGLSGGFFFDDWPNILLEEGVRLTSLTPDSLLQALTSGRSGPSGRPVAQLTFALNHYFSGFDPFAFKATNLAIHLACGLLVYRLTLRLLASAAPGASRRALLISAGSIAVLWLVHPIQLLPVLHVVQRMTSLSSLFLLTALLLHINARERSGVSRAVLLVLAWLVLWPLSFFSKETGVLFPLFVLAWELILRRNTFKQLDFFARCLAILAGLAIAASCIYAFSPAGQWFWAGYAQRGFSLVERLLTEGRVIWFYLGLIFFPRFEAFGLYHDDFLLSTDLLTPWTTLPSLFGLLGLVGLAWRTRTRVPVVSFGIAWFLIGHLLESTVLSLEIAHEHRNHLPSIGILLAGAWVLLCALERKDASRTIGVMLASAALGYFAFVTTLRAHQFGDEYRMTQIEAQHHRTSSRAQYQAGHALAKLPESALPSSPIYVFARNHFELSSDLDKNSKLGVLGLIYLECKANIAPNRVEIDELARRLRETPFAPSDSNVILNIKELSISGTLCLARPDVEKLFDAALANPGVLPWQQANLYSWLADYYWLALHDMVAARQALAKSLSLNPYNPSNRLKWAQLLFLAKEYQQAKELLFALKNERLPAEERKTLGELLIGLGIAQ